MTEAERRKLADAARGMAFFCAVRALEDASGKGPQIGTAAKPQDEGVRFSPSPDIAFASTFVTDVRWPDPLTPNAAVDDDERCRRRFVVETSEFGLYGIRGPLPPHYTDKLLDGSRRRADDDGRTRLRLTPQSEAFKDFLDIANHRILSMLYRAGTRYRFAWRWFDGGAEDYRRYLASLVGLADEPLRNRLPFDDDRLFEILALLRHGPRSAALVERAVRVFFDEAPVEIEPFVLRTFRLPVDDRTRLDPHRPPRLGADGDVVLGDRATTLASTFAVRIGPLDQDQFRRLLPGEPEASKLWALVRFVAGPGLEFEFRLGVRAADVPGTRLGDRGARLGQSTWLGAPRGGRRSDAWDCRLRSDYWGDRVKADAKIAATSASQPPSTSSGLTSARPKDSIPPRAPSRIK